jgi:hypothetical protein
VAQLAEALTALEPKPGLVAKVAELLVKADSANSTPGASRHE